MSHTAFSQHASNTLTHGLDWHLARLSGDWRDAFDEDTVQAGLQRVSSFLEQRLAANAIIYPRFPFRALDAIAPQGVKVIILGQDPYHGPGQAQGLAFSVPNTCQCPPSLRNILSELKQEYPEQLHNQGHDLSSWAKQGVLLLNTVLTVEAGQAASHTNQGWETVTDAIIRHVVRISTPKVFMLWGAHAQRKRELLEQYATGPIHILTANHPSPLSARRPPQPFMGCGHFRSADSWLTGQGLTPVNWLSL